MAHISQSVHVKVLKGPKNLAVPLPRPPHPNAVTWANQRLSLDRDLRLRPGLSFPKMP